MAEQATNTKARPIMPSIKLVPVLLAGLALAACGHNTEQRAATGAATGAVVAGPAGAVVGAAAGTVVSKANGEDKK
jgi:osmotically inducible lipoprotein OsmB